MTHSVIRKAQACGSVEELLALAEENGISITAEEAQAYLDELSSVELSLDDLDQAAGGFCKQCYLINGCGSNFNGDRCLVKFPCPQEEGNPCPDKDWTRDY